MRGGQGSGGKDFDRGGYYNIAPGLSRVTHGLDRPQQERDSNYDGHGGSAGERRNATIFLHFIIFLYRFWAFL